MGEQRECRCVEIEVGGMQAHKERWKWRGAYIRMLGYRGAFLHMSGYRGAYRCTEIEMYRDADT